MLKIQWKAGEPPTPCFARFGTVAILLVIVSLLSWQIFKPPPQKQIERRLESSGAISVERLPSAEQILSWSQQLDLGRQQEIELEELIAKKIVELQPLSEHINSELLAFDLKTKQTALSLAEIQSVARPISELSLRKRLLERNYAQRALRLLQPAQKTKALKLARAIGMKGTARSKVGKD